jgi:hypothetical protein
VAVQFGAQALSTVMTAGCDSAGSSKSVRLAILVGCTGVGLGDLEAGAGFVSSMRVTLEIVNAGQSGCLEDMIGE